MAIPDYQTFMLPVLRRLADGDERAIGRLSDDVANDVGLTAEERRELLPSGKQAIIRNRVAWAKTYLVKAGVVEPTRRGHFRITERGRELLNAKPTRVDNRVLSKYPEFEAWRSASAASASSNRSSASQNPADNALETPEEILGAAYRRIRQDLADDLLTAVKSSSPSFFNHCRDQRYSSLRP